MSKQLGTDLSELTKGHTLSVVQADGSRAVYRVADARKAADGTWTLDIEPIDGPPSPLYTYTPTEGS